MKGFQYRATGEYSSSPSESHDLSESDAEMGKRPEDEATNAAHASQSRPSPRLPVFEHPPPQVIEWEDSASRAETEADRPGALKPEPSRAEPVLDRSPGVVDHRRAFFASPGRNFGFQVFEKRPAVWKNCCRIRNRGIEGWGIFSDGAVTWTVAPVGVGYCPR